VYPAIPNSGRPAALGRLVGVNVSRLVLASRSPRRLALLEGLGLSFEVDPPDLSEERHAGESPVAMVARLSRAKALAVAARHPDALVVAADTTVATDGEVLEKPRDASENAAFLRRLSGRDHVVHTGHCLVHAGCVVDEVRSTTVRFRTLDEDEVAWYAASGEGIDKAGGYAIQGLGACLVEAVDGCYTNVVGLSLPTVLRGARALGVRLV
jgi:septum formation protein